MHHNLILDAEHIAWSLDHRVNHTTNKDTPTPSSVRVMSHNANILRKKQAWQTYATQLDKHKIDLAATFEARPRTNDITIIPGPNAPYVVAHSKATVAGLYGIAVWISTTAPLATLGKTTVKARIENVATRSLEPRILLLRIVCHHVRLLIIANHAPHRADDKNTNITHWADLSKHGNTHRKPNDTILYLTDANATLRDGTPHGDSHDDHLATFLHEHSLLEHTHSDSHHQPTHRITYITGPDTGTHNEYIATSNDTTADLRATETLHDFYSFVPHDDHVAIITTITLPPKKERTTTSRRRPTYQRTDIAANIDGIKDRLTQVRTLPYQVEPTTHTHIIDHAILQILEDECPIRKTPPPRVVPC